MKSKRILKTLAIVTVLISNIGCDQISKSIVRERIGYDEQIILINNCFTLTKIENTGAFLSLGGTLPEPIKSLLLTILPLIALGFGCIYLMVKRNLSRLSLLGISFALGGGIGNVYDRAIYGSVTDFMHIDFYLFQTGIFNMADVSIMIGLSFILIESYFNRKDLTDGVLDERNTLS
jgi:signal peptidase II